MILDRLILNNFGLYAGRQVILLTPPSGAAPLVLFGGMNGAGKTTLLDAIQLVLYGRLAPCVNGGYTDYLERCMHHGTTLADGSGLELDFRHHEDGVEVRYYLQRSWSKVGKTVKEQLDVRVNGKPKNELSQLWPSKVEDILPVRLAPLFFFDGEKIEGFADPSRSAELLRTGVHSLLGLDIVDQLTTDLTVLEQRKRAQDMSQEDKLDVQRLEEQVAAREGHCMQLKQEKAHTLSLREQAEHRRQQIDEQFRRQGGDLYLQRRELEERREQQRKAVAMQEDRLRELALDVAPLAIIRPLLTETLEQARAELRAEEARVLDRALSERDQRLIELLKQLTLERHEVRKVEQHLNEDRAERRKLGHQKSVLRLDAETFKQLEHLCTSNLMGLDEQLQREFQALDELKQQLAESDRLLAGMPGKEQIIGLLQQRDAYDQRIASLRLREDELQEQLRSVERELEKERARYRQVLERQAQRELEQRKAQEQLGHLIRAKSSLARFRKQVLRTKLQRIEQEIKTCYQQLLHKDQLMDGLEIEPETFRLTLRDPSGAILEPARLSAGERQLLAVAILWGLARASGRNLPVVVDTPMGRLDSQHRTHLLLRYFPHASRQVILLSTDEEIDQAAYNLLKPSIGHLYRLQYQDHTRATQVQAGYFAQVEL